MYAILCYLVGTILLCAYVLTNNNSEYAFVIGKGVLDILQGKEPTSYYQPEEDLTSWDNIFSLFIIFAVVKRIM